MARVTTPATGSTTYHTVEFPALFLDYVSLTDTNAQTIASDVTISGDLTVTGALAFGAKGLASGRSPITVAHGLSDVTSSNTIVFLCVRALQPYVVGYNIDATNITIYHNAVGSLIIAWFAFKI